MATRTQAVTHTTANLIADTKTGHTDRTIVVGAHLDSVPEGPGINDNGSGSRVGPGDRGGDGRLGDAAAQPGRLRVLGRGGIGL